MTKQLYRLLVATLMLLACDSAHAAESDARTKTLRGVKAVIVQVVANGDLSTDERFADAALRARAEAALKKVNIGVYESDRFRRESIRPQDYVYLAVNLEAVGTRTGVIFATSCSAAQQVALIRDGKRTLAQTWPRAPSAFTARIELKRFLRPSIGRWRSS